MVGCREPSPGGKGRREDARAEEGEQRPERRGRGRGEPAVGCGDWLRVPPETAGRGRGGPGPS